MPGESGKTLQRAVDVYRKDIVYCIVKEFERDISSIGRINSMIVARTREDPAHVPCPDQTF